MASAGGVVRVPSLYFLEEKYEGGRELRVLEGKVLRVISENCEPPWAQIWGRGRMGLTFLSVFCLPDTVLVLQLLHLLKEMQYL